MNEPKWISREDIEDIHEVVIEIGGGSHGLRDAALLESALGRPQNHYAYGETDMFQLAAGYAESISRNHPFIDGNKRTAFQAAHQFLKDNGHHLEKSVGSKHADMMVQLATGEISREAMGAYLSENSHDQAQEQQTDHPPAPPPQPQDSDPAADNFADRARTFMEERDAEDRGARQGPKTGPDYKR